MAMASPMISREEERILRDAILKNPDEGWKALWKVYSRDIYGRIASYRLPPEDLEEVVQEFSFRIAKDDFKLLQRWDPERCSLRGYLRVIVSSCSLDFLKSPFFKQKTLFKNTQSENSVTENPLDFLEDEGLTPDERLNQREILRTVRACLDEWVSAGRLNLRDRLLLELRLAGAGYEEIARTLGVSREAATKQFSRLREELQKRLENRGISILDADTPKRMSR